jgi:nitrogen fixation protein FixH
MGIDRNSNSRRPRPVTGRMVLVCLLAFFAVVAGVNAIMIRAAISTFGGLETESSYKAGLAFAGEIAAAEAQEARHWQVKAMIQPAVDGERRIEVLARDAVDRALSGIAANVVLSHPTDRRSDQRIVMAGDGAGRFSGKASAATGQWDVIIELDRGGERLFRSKSRMMLQ